MYLNRENQFAVKVGETWKPLKGGVYNWSPSIDQTVISEDYYDGTTASDVTRTRRTFSFSARNITDDAAQHIWGLRDKVGADCKGQFKWTPAGGTEEVWNVNFQNINPSGGDASGKDGFTFDVVRESVAS